MVNPIDAAPATVRDLRRHSEIKFWSRSKCAAWPALKPGLSRSRMATMQRNILIIIGRPDPAPDRCLRALAEAYARGARASHADLMSADHLLLCYPLWLGDVPALFKGFLEQVLRI